MFGRIKPGEDLTKYFIHEGKGLKNKGLHIRLLHKFEECSLIDGEKYFEGYDREGFDINGYDRDGYDVFGFNKFGFDSDNINKTTNTKYDERGFYYDVNSKHWINRYTNNEYDLLGYNIEGFSEEGKSRVNSGRGFKKIRYQDRVLYVSTETSYIYDRYGRLYNEKTGKTELATSIKSSREIIALILGSNKSLDEVCRIFMKKDNISLAEAKTYIQKSLKDGFNLYETCSLKCFNEGDMEIDGRLVEFKGLEHYYFTLIASTEKRKRLDEFFTICPEARKILIHQAKESFRRIKIIEDRETKGQAQQRTPEELQKGETDKKSYSELIKRYGFDDGER